MTSLRFDMIPWCIPAFWAFAVAVWRFWGWVLASERTVPGVVGRASLRQVELVVRFTFFRAAAARHLASPLRSGLGLFLLAPSCWMTWG